MINKFFKTIHIKYSKFFSFIFFLRYLFLIFLIFIMFLLIIPSFFDYGKKIEIIKSHLLSSYDLKINNYEKIKFRAFPLPNLELTNVNIDLKNTTTEFNISKFKIYPKIFSIYNYANFQSNKIILKDGSVFVKVSNLKNFTQKLLTQQNKLSLNNLDLKILHDNKPLVELENIKFANFGYSENLITGKVFKKKFKIKIKDDIDSIFLKLLNSGFEASINFNESKNSNEISGIFKSKVLNTNLRFNFDYDEKSIKINKSYFRSKNLSFSNKSKIILKPFLKIESRFIIEDINADFFKNSNIDDFLKSKNIIKKLNLKSEIEFKPKKFIYGDFIDKLNLKLDLAYGRINFINKFYISKNIFDCNGNINFLQEFPLIFFDCKISSTNEQQFLKEFSIKSKNKNMPMSLIVKGNLNLFNNKINFENIKLNKNYEASKEDLQFFKNNFEDILFDENFLGIFNIKKIKKFILAIK